MFSFFRELFANDFPRCQICYPPSCPIKYPSSTPQVSIKLTHQVKELITKLSGELTRKEIQERVGLSDRMTFMTNYLNPALEGGLIEMTIPDKPNSSLQKYRLSALGKQAQEKL